MGRRKPNRPRRERPYVAPQALGDQKLVAAVKLLAHTGARDFTLRYCDEDKPVVWMALATYERSGESLPQVAAALNPVAATLQLCEQLVDGGVCLRCNRPTGFEPDSLDTMPADEHVCWFQWDPELTTFRRGCAGDSENEGETECRL